MPAKELIIERPAQKRLRKLPLHIHTKIIKVFETIKQNPIVGVKLHGELSDYYKLRVGDYRIVYKFDNKQSLVEIVKVEHRQGSYK